MRYNFLFSYLLLFIIKEILFFCIKVYFVLNNFYRLVILKGCFGLLGWCVVGKLRRCLYLWNGLLFIMKMFFD